MPTRRARLRAIRLRLRELARSGRLAQIERPYPPGAAQPFSLECHIGTLLELAARLERASAEQKRADWWRELAAYVGPELERVAAWLDEGDQDRAIGTDWR